MGWCMHWNLFKITNSKIWQNKISTKIMGKSTIWQFFLPTPSPPLTMLWKKDQNLHDCFWCVHNIVKKGKLASPLLMCSPYFTGSQHCSQFCSTVLDAFTTLWKKEPNLHQHFWCVTTLSNKDRDLRHCFWRIHNIWKKAPNLHNRVCAHNIVNKDRNLHRCYLCVHNIVKKVTDDWWVHKIVKKDWNFYDGFWWVENVVKKT